MCTVSWVEQATGYELFCNRDERRTRPVAWPPQVRKRRGVQFIAPIDAAGGGTWIGVNQFGLTLCLLNRYEQPTPSVERDYLTRGWLVLDLIACRTPTEVQSQLDAATLTHFQPFTLIALQQQHTARLFAWNGIRLQSDAPAATQLPLTSSSYETTNVIASRRARFAMLAQNIGTLDAATLDAYHHSHTPDAAAYAVCMHRPDAQTVSYSRIKVTAGHIEFLYSSHAPCQAEGTEPYATSLTLVTP